MTEQVRRGFIEGKECAVDAAAVERAVALAAAALDKVRRTSSFDRAAVLDKVAVALAAMAAEIAQALADESGYLTVKDMTLEVQRAIEVFTLTAAYARAGMSETLNVDAVERARGAVAYIRREPIGPVLGITAYNGPLLIAAHKIAPAIAAGAPIVLKPSPRVPLATIRLARTVVEAGWPREAVAVLDVDNDATMALVRDPRLPVVSFTGGMVGWKIKEAVPLKRVHLELGGVGAVFVASDGNVALAAQECAAGGFVRSGQSCISVQRIYVERPRYQEFVDAFIARVGEMRPDSPAAIGPMVDDAAAKRVEAVIIDAISRGATLACGGNRQGAYIEPTVITGATGEMTVMRNEIFGPVVAVSAVDSADEAITEMNAVSGAIHHGIYTANIDTAFRMSDEIRAGGVIINGPGTWRVDHMPYGGTGTSGFGREGARFAVEEYTEPKVIVVRPSVPRPR
ncbi:putative succinate-semialdehyde dehydrogenase I, NADP-dependent [Mesorhizobium plurifarium]|uniref:Putative succinate-semialdehyde dehydrogenase I, NADP-dependent n=1 Tax=Mesorhizobium plurifarium TaxID=69974 RepID=A0A0K2W0V6_MESPL|nr:putative succinate-semialdehyde dehydrogenase I, NADP-dependent [Mesorhizobium plurifarium]